LTSAGSSDTESTPELVSDDGMGSVVYSRNPTIVYDQKQPTCIGTQTKSLLSVNSHAAAEVNSWANERDQVAVGIDAYRFHSKVYPPAPAWSLDASAFTLVQ
jgi:hypothetical protein